jgi:predicted TIM-barrel fold metal-dependent hydrolase
VEIKYGLISADSHAAFACDDFTSRMSLKKWGDRIPHVAPYEKNGEILDGWRIYDSPASGQVCNCPAAMGEPFPHWPKRWEEVPSLVYSPRDRLKALDTDRVDAEVLFPNPPGGAYYQYKDLDFEFDVVRAYNDTLSDWVRLSDRYLPLAILPFLQAPAVIAREIERAVENGHKGVNVPGQMPVGLPHLADPYWYPIWDVCAEMGIALHFHAMAGLRSAASTKTWSGYSPRQAHAAMTSTGALAPTQIIPQLIFSGVTERFPNLKCVFAEAGLGGLSYLLATCDHEWESRHLWTEGLKTRPSEVLKRQMYMNFWFEAEGIKVRHEIGIDNIMWEADFPHVAAYYPNSWDAIERVLDGVPPDERRKLLYENAIRVYRINVTTPA